MKQGYNSPGHSKSLQCTQSCSSIIKEHISYSGVSRLLTHSSSCNEIRGIEKLMMDHGILAKDEQVIGVVEELSYADTIGDLEECIQGNKNPIQQFVPVNSVEMYMVINDFLNNTEEARVDTKYKTVEKKVKPVATPLPARSYDDIRKVSEEPILRDPNKVGHSFSSETKKKLQVGKGEFLFPGEEECFREMLEQHGKAFAFDPSEIGCADPKVIAPMIIFTVPHIPWNFKPIPVPKAHIPKLIELLKEKVKMGILEPSNAPYSNRWFTVPKKNGSLRFIQDLQPVNKVTIRNSGIGPMVDSFAEAFAGRAIYSMGDLYSGYDQFQLALDSRDITTMRTPIGLVRMCTLPQGATNSVAHMMNAMHKVLADYIPELTMPFLDDVPIKGCYEEEKDETLDQHGCRYFVKKHILDCEKILCTLEDAKLTFSGEKSVFGKPEIVIVGHLCGPFGRRPAPSKVDAIQAMKDECESITEVRRFLGACVFYQIWIPHFAHIADPLYQLLRKGQKFTWSVKHTHAIQRLKAHLRTAPALRKADYSEGKTIFVTVDTSPTGIGWVINQEDFEGNRYAIRFGAKVLQGRQRKYAQIKREMWGIISAIKADRDYLIGAEVVIETDCLPILGMVSSCSSPDITMLRWIAYIKSFNPELRHISGKNNAMADMLSRARFVDKLDMMDEDEEIEDGFFVNTLDHGNGSSEFHEEEYDQELSQIGRFLRSHNPDPTWSFNEFKRIRKKAYKFFLQDGYLWKQPRKITEPPVRVLGRNDQQQKVINEFHDSQWAGHRGVWATFSKIKERYWWPGMYKDIANFVSTCVKCQVYSKIRHRDGLHPTYSPSIHFKWMVDLISMPLGVGQVKYLVLAREDLTNQVEGRALRGKSTKTVCQFLLEDVICRYGCIGQVIADRGELNSEEAQCFFQKHGIRLSLTTAYNPEANGKIERGHSPIIRALIKACDGKVREWPTLLPYALWADRTTHSSVTGFMPAELMLGQKPIMPTEEDLITWATLPWEDEMSREDLLSVRIRQLERRPEDVSAAAERLRYARERNKAHFDKTHRLRPKKVEEGDWVLVYDSSLDHQHSSLRKFARRWFGPYVVWKTYDNGTYRLKELDGTMLQNPVAGKRVKIFKKRQDSCPSLTYSDEEGREEGITSKETEDEDEGGTSMDNLVTTSSVET